VWQTKYISRTTAYLPCPHHCCLQITKTRRSTRGISTWRNLQDTSRHCRSYAQQNISVPIFMMCPIDKNSFWDLDRSPTCDPRIEVLLPQHQLLNVACEHPWSMIVNIASFPLIGGNPVIKSIAICWNGQVSDLVGIWYRGVLVWWVIILFCWHVAYPLM